MTNKELYTKLGISKKAFYNYVKMENPMPKTYEGAKEWLKERQAFTEQGSGQITIGGREYTKDDLIDLRGQILELNAKEKQSKIDLQEFELAKKRGELVPRHELLQTLKTILEPLGKLLEQLPNKIASQVNPENSDMAYQVLEREVQTIFGEIQKQKNNHVK